jgi:2',3'-cyclic-nucleotide 2'-phosphodiesterase (5'-nucleotidase family)
MQLLMKPYRDSIEKTMNEVVGYAGKTLEKKQPEGSLGNFMADAMLYGARTKFNLPVDVSMINSGGIRITQLPQGAVTRGKVFELMPFDNLIVVQELKGSELQQMLDITASRGGWPTAGLTMQIKDKKAVNVKINGAPLDNNKVYLVANSDYVANGGDDAAVLKALPQKNLGYLFRDAIFDYIRFLKLQGKDISAQEENRVSNAQ